MLLEINRFKFNYIKEIILILKMQMSQPQDDIFPWAKIFDYKDELNDHFEDINERITMVANEGMTY
jgi:hypothetical protein